MVHVDDSFWLQGSSLYALFLSTGMRVQLIFWARFVKSLWDFRHWILDEKSHKMDYSLGLFRAVGSEVIFYGGVMSHMDPTWHAYMALVYSKFYSSAWHVGHVISSSTWSNGIVLTLGASYVIFAHWPLGGFHTMYSWLYILSLYIHWDIVYSLGKGYWSCWPLLPLCSISFYVTSCLESWERGGHHVSPRSTLHV